MSYQATWQPGEMHFYAASLYDPLLFAPQASYHAEEMLPWSSGVLDLPSEGHSLFLSVRIGQGRRPGESGNVYSNF